MPWFGFGGGGREGATGSPSSPVSNNKYVQALREFKLGTVFTYMRDDIRGAVEILVPRALVNSIVGAINLVRKKEDDFDKENVYNGIVSAISGIMTVAFVPVLFFGVRFIATTLVGVFGLGSKAVSTARRLDD